MKVHETWRVEIGWMAAVGGAALLLFGVINQISRGMIVDTGIEPWIVYLVAGILLVGGWGLRWTNTQQRASPP